MRVARWEKRLLKIPDLIWFSDGWDRKAPWTMPFDTVGQVAGSCLRMDSGTASNDRQDYKGAVMTVALRLVYRFVN
jgi:hypothetical protein